MIAVDTNVLVRYVVGDDPVQARVAARLIEGTRERSEPVFLSCVVLVETVWVLSAAYQIKRAAVLATLQRILEASEAAGARYEGPSFVIEHEEAVREAVDDYASGRAGFADYLIGRLARGGGATTTYTFDRRAGSAPTFKRL